MSIDGLCRLRIDVTAEDIVAGRHRLPDRCPIALAATRALGVAAYVTKYCVYTANGHQVIGGLPGTATNFVYEFDTEKPVAPFSFDLILSPNFDRIGV